MADEDRDVERVANWLWVAASTCGKVSEVRAVLRVMMDQAIASEGERAENGVYAEGSAPELVSRIVSQWDELVQTITAEADGTSEPEPALPESPSEFKRPPYPSLIDEAIAAKGPTYSEASACTFRTDSLAILESFVAEADERAVVAALNRQGFRSSGSYLTTLRALAAVAASRRPSH